MNTENLSENAVVQNLAAGGMKKVGENAAVGGFKSRGLWAIERGRFAIVCFAIARMLIGAPPAWGAQALWIGNLSGENIEDFTAAELSASGAPTPNFLVSSGHENTGVAFDKGQNLWAVRDGNSLAEFSATQLMNLATNQFPTPVAIITSPSFVSITGCALDGGGNLWVADARTKVYEISHRQLAAGTASITPAITIAVPAFNYVNFIAFDSSGNLWASDENNDAVYQLTKKQLKHSGSKTPAVSITSPSFSDPGQLAFDGGGNLWVSQYSGGVLLEFTKKSIKRSGSPAPAVTIGNFVIGILMNSLDGPWGLAFDKGGNLWVSNYNDGSITEFGRFQILTTGSPDPAVHLTNTNTGFLPYQITFGPNF